MVADRSGPKSSVIMMLTSRDRIAARAEIHGEHLVFLRSDGNLAALFVLEIVESWSEFELYNAWA
jgi:hypothetical protein